MGGRTRPEVICRPGEIGLDQLEKAEEYPVVRASLLIVHRLQVQIGGGLFERLHDGTVVVAPEQAAEVRRDLHMPQGVDLLGDLEKVTIERRAPRD